jgi:hypothetical protein
MKTQQCCSVPISCVCLPETVLAKGYNFRSALWPYDAVAFVSLFKNESCRNTYFLSGRCYKGGILKLLSVIYFTTLHILLLEL